jgi:hypothetical protein
MMWQTTEHLEAHAMQADVAAVESMLAYILFHLESRKNFDHAVGMLALTLQVHSVAISEHDCLSQAAKTVQEKLGRAWRSVDMHVQYLRCMASVIGEMQAL